MATWNIPLKKSSSEADKTPSVRFIKRLLLVIFLLFSMPIGPVLLGFRWYCTDLSSACASFEDFLAQCIDPDEPTPSSFKSTRTGFLNEI